MRTHIIGAVLLCGCAVLTGCASRGLSEHQCLAGDWRTIGERDGASGSAPTQVLAHQNACGPHGIVPDSLAYRAGWETGIARFCQPDRGYELGLAGRAYPNVCPESLAPSHQQAYFDGRELFLARAQVRDLEARIARAEDRRQRIDGEILGLVTAQTEPSLSPTERLELVDKTRALLSEREALDAEIPALHAALDDAYEELDDVEQSLASR